MLCGTVVEEGEEAEVVVGTVVGVLVAIAVGAGVGWVVGDGVGVSVGHAPQSAGQVLQSSSIDA